mmetsp:Transcript_8526/g.26639  ORF Transcript_8526/g.26639 Transcript_8526/m.26639 type:complete len:92 (-) Transcript_8526:63-338(-)
MALKSSLVAALICSAAGFSAVAPQASTPAAPASNGFFEWQSKLIADLESKYAKAAPVVVAEVAVDEEAETVEETAPAPKKGLLKRIMFWRK